MVCGLNRAGYWQSLWRHPVPFFFSGTSSSRSCSSFGSFAIPLVAAGGAPPVPWWPRGGRGPGPYPVATFDAELKPR